MTLKCSKCGQILNNQDIDCEELGIDKNYIEIYGDYLDMDNLICKNCKNEQILTNTNNDSLNDDAEYQKSDNHYHNSLEDENKIFRDIMDYFPQDLTPRDEQITIFKKIAEGIANGYHFFLLDAGTGIGKSAIAVTLAEYFGEAFITTVTKQLQDQYLKDYNYPVLKGRTNFICKEALVFNKNKDCDEGICQAEKINCDKGVSKSEGTSFCFEDRIRVEWDFISEDHCNYWEQKGTAIRSPITFLNYSSFFIEMNFLTHFKKRKLSVFDEAHNIERLVMKLVSFKLSNKKLKSEFKDHMDDITPEGEIKFIPQISPDAFIEDKEFWSNYLPKFIKDYKSLLKTRKLTPKKSKKIRNKVYRMSKFLDDLRINPHNWIIEANEKDEKIEFKPLEVSKYIHSYCFEHSEYNLLMSATILNKEDFCKWHGINPEDVLYIPIKSPFDLKKRPIYLETVGSMSHKTIEVTKPLTIPLLKKLLNKHNDDKGLIHTNSHKLATYIYKELDNPRLINYSFDESNPKERPKRDSIIKRFIESSEPLVLVAPSVGEGVDFPDDLCRFQIIYKVPFPYLNDKQIKARNRIDPNWYAYQTVVKLVQSYGRGMRNKNDYCDTYITDEDIFSILTDKWRRCWKYFPEYFLEALIDPEGIIDDFKIFSNKRM
ncbi:MAG: ATP-dependent DNA helicase [Methanobacteriaceae archaeon]|nr:ATP-dependent DNA helicase [Methanobacteriaceae archaeon]